MAHQTDVLVDDLSFPGRVLESSRPTLVLFTADGCPPCEFLARRLPALAPEVDPPVDVVRCPVETSPWTFRRYGISRTPTLLLFNDGLQIASRVGPTPIPGIRRWVADSLARRSNPRPVQISHDSTPVRLLLRHALGRPILLRSSRIAGVVAPALFFLDHYGLPSSSLSSYRLLGELSVDFLIPLLVASYVLARAATARDASDPGADA